VPAATQLFDTVDHLGVKEEMAAQVSSVPSVTQLFDTVDHLGFVEEMAAQVVSSVPAATQLFAFAVPAPVAQTPVQSSSSIQKTLKALFIDMKIKIIKNPCFIFCI
jgi:hypothetical protein